MLEAPARLRLTLGYVAGCLLTNATFVTSTGIEVLFLRLSSNGVWGTPMVYTIGVVSPRDMLGCCWMWRVVHGLNTGSVVPAGYVGKLMSQPARPVIGVRGNGCVLVVGGGIWVDTLCPAQHRVSSVSSDRRERCGQRQLLLVLVCRQDAQTGNVMLGVVGGNCGCDSRGGSTHR